MYLIAGIDYCNGHTDLCMERTGNASLKGSILKGLNINRNEFIDTLTHGPQSDAICLQCQNLTTNDRCDGCIHGHFRGAEDYRLPCRKCHCQVHKQT